MSPVWSILPPSIGPSGTRLKRPIPRFRTYIQYKRPRSQRIDSVVKEPYFAINSGFFSRFWRTDTPRNAFEALFGWGESVTLCCDSFVVRRMVSPGDVSVREVIKSSTVMISVSSMLVIRVSDWSPASIAGEVSWSATDTIFTWSSSIILFVRLGRTQMKRPMITNAARMFENGPAAKIASCCFFGIFFTCFSSGSTKAAGRIGRRMASAANPEDFTFTPYLLANTPWENSWITASVNIDIIQ